MSDLVVVPNCCILECVPEKLSWCRNEPVVREGKKCTAL